MDKQTEKELRRLAELEAREEKLAEQRDLKSIRHEMRGGLLRGLLPRIVLSVLGGALVLVGIYVMISGSQVKQGRLRYQAALSTMDAVRIRRFASEELAQAEALWEQGEKLNSLFTRRKALDAYGQALVKLRQADQRAQDVWSGYKTVAERFVVLKREAISHSIDELSPELWKNVLALEAEAGDERSASFDPDHAVKKLQSANAVLSQMRPYYRYIREYEQAEKQYAGLLAQAVPGEWKVNLAEEHARIRKLVENAESASRRMDWQRGTGLYQQAAIMLQDGQEQLIRKRMSSQQLVRELDLSLKQANQEEMKRYAERAWGEIQGLRQSAEADLQQYEYGKVEELVGKARQLLEETSRKVVQAQRSHEAILSRFETLYRQLAARPKYYRRNWPEQWQVIETGYQRIQKLKQGSDYVEMVDLAKLMSAKTDQLLDAGDQLMAAAEKAKNAFGSLFAGANPDLLKMNAPSLWDQVIEGKAQAERAEKLEDLQAAADANQAAADRLDQALRELARLQESTTQARGSSDQLLGLYQKGIEAFMPESRNTIKDLAQRGDVLWRQRRWREAEPLYLQLQKLLPAERFVYDLAGVVQDFRTGLMWPRDGAGAGCNAGNKQNWYDTLVWVDKLVFAGFDDWRLPTDDELQHLLELDAQDYGRVFLNFPPEKYWTATSSSLDITQAYVADFAIGKMTLALKKQAGSVRPVRSPRR